MASEEPREDKCGARVSERSDGSGYCELPKGYDTDHLGEGRCKYHGGRGGSFEAGNNAAETHALYSQRTNYYNNREPQERAWIDSLVESMMEDAPFTRDNFQKFQMVREVAIDMHKKRRSNDYIAENGIVDEQVVRDDEGNPIVRDGELVTETEENPVHLMYDRLDRTMTKKMKELGIMEDEQAQATQNIASELAALREEQE